MNLSPRRRVFKGYGWFVLYTMYWLIAVWILSESLLFPLILNRFWAWPVGIAFWLLPPILGYFSSFTTRRYPP